MSNPSKYSKYQMRFSEILTEAALLVYRGEYSGNRGGNFWSPEKEFARQFTQSGQDKEIKTRYISSNAIYRPSEPVYAGNMDAVDAVIEIAKEKGYKAVWLDEGQNEPDSIFVFDRSALKLSRMLAEDAQKLDMTKIRAIAEQFREWMEGIGYDEMAKAVGYGEISRNGYGRFEGFCNVASRKLAEIYLQHGFNATSELWEYHGDDQTYWETHGSAFYNSPEEFEEADPWEYGEAHEIVIIDGKIIVDVTSDQFNPENPEAHRVIITTTSDRHYV